MTSELLAGVAKAPLDACAREPLEARLAHYDREYRRALRNLARRSREFGDLLYTFPGAAMALVGGRAPAAGRKQAERMLDDGRPLAEVAKALGLPMWLKRLPPEAFDGPPGAVPDGQDFACRIVNHLPRSVGESAAWLRLVTFGAEACNPAFALWLAQRPFEGQAPEGGPRLVPLAAYAWFSGQGNAQARKLMAWPWHKKMAFANAASELNAWIERLVLGYCVEGAGAPQSWPQSAQMDNYCFAPLYSLQELSDEAKVMRNCLANYAAQAAAGHCLIYSIRRDGVSVANMEVRLDRYGRLVITQLLGAGNAQSSPDVKWAAEVWLARQTAFKMALRKPTGTDAWEQLQILAHRWEKIWRPYLEAKPQYAKLLGTPCRVTLLRLRNDAKALAQWA